LFGISVGYFLIGYIILLTLREIEISEVK
jgi:hypothetical protein